MFDAKSLLEQLAGAGGGARGAGPGSQASGSELGDLLGQVLGGGPQGSGNGGLMDLVRNAVGDSGAGPGTGSGAGGMSDILAQIQNTIGGGQGPGGAGVGDTLRQVLEQATQGVQEGATRIGEATGARDALTNATGGRTPEELMQQVKDLIANNQLTAGAVLGGLGGLMLGTRTGRGLLTGAAKLGAGAMIGGLAYKAYQNYQDGKPLITGRSGLPEKPPQGSGFEPGAISNETAALMLRAMIAAAASDGRIDEAEKGRIRGALRQGGIDREAEAFLLSEIANPSKAADIAAGVRSMEEGVQVYTAARIAIDPDTTAEALFLRDLAGKLGIDEKLADHINATTKSAMAV